MTLNSMSAYPKTHTDLFLRPAKEVFDRMSVVEQYPFEYDLSIPVSPSVLNYKRDAEHNEVYSVVKGGMLERNLPGLWQVSVETYVPREIWERAFHNRRIVKRSKKTNDSDFTKQEFYPQGTIDERTGRVESCKYQQEFVNYVNRLMDWKVPCQLWDDSNPVRINHQPKYFCIKHFDYKMLPHDDIEYTLDLIEWKEPTVKVSDLVVPDEENETEEPKPKVPGASGNAIMAFGHSDRRNHNDGRVYSADTVAARINPDGSIITTMYKKPNTWRKQLIQLSDVIGIPGRISSHTSISSSGQWEYHEDYMTMEFEITHPIYSQAVSSPTSQSYSAYEKVYPTEMKEIAQGVKSFASNETKGGSKLFAKMDTGNENNANTQIKTLAGGSLSSNLNNNMWAKKIKMMKNVPAFHIEVEFDKSATEMLYHIDGNYIVTKATAKWKVARSVWYKTMYLLKPIAGKDKVYDATFTYLCPLENTIVTPYQKYLNTFDAKFIGGKGTEDNNGVNKYHAERSDGKVVNNVLPEVTTLKTGQKTLTEEIHKGAQK